MSERPGPYEQRPPLPALRRTRVPAVVLTVLAVTALAGCGGTAVGDGQGRTKEALPQPGRSTVEGAAPSAAPSPSSSQPLAGKTVVIDPGHNPGNFDHPREIAEQVDIGTNSKDCDSTGTASNDGYREAEFTLDVSRRLRDLLEKQGATVKLTQDDDRPYGPCIDERARIGNEAEADAVLSVHADGSASGNRGYHLILPALVKEGGADTSQIVGPSRELGEHIAEEFGQATGTEPSNYVGGGTGLHVRDDLGGLNLSTVPKVFIECGNMRDAKDLALLESPEWRQKAAQGMANGITAFLAG
ncbi:N-acetylmuramoyl-L-alanine amidase [Streptomyces sp. MUM 178J]|uniref:N-acetylmuramoyl-L-alanine amidase n=1 Tax=Streptomyces sp. MUM 178J TaxID=2791991 RepID=UPI003FA75196